MTAPLYRYNCLVCCAPKAFVAWGLCALCQRSYDRALAKDQTIMGAIVWAAQRARRAERARFFGKLPPGWRRIKAAADVGLDRGDERRQKA